MSTSSEIEQQVAMLIPKLVEAKETERRAVEEEERRQPIEEEEACRCKQKCKELEQRWAEMVQCWEQERREEEAHAKCE